MQLAVLIVFAHANFYRYIPVSFYKYPPSPHSIEDATPVYKY